VQVFLRQILIQVHTGFLTNFHVGLIEQRSF